jgi:dephospho-CoA kinase
MRRRRKNKHRIVVGVTGSFGSGKTTVAKLLKGFGAEVIDADALAHEVIAAASPAYKKILSVFGNNVLNARKEIDRRRLSDFAFSKKRLLAALNRIVHPEVINRIRRHIRDSSASVVVVDAPLLIESGLYKDVDIVVVVKAKRGLQISRLKKRALVTRHQFAQRLRFQAPLRSKLRYADFIIDNSGTIRQTKQQVESLRRIVWKS